MHSSVDRDSLKRKAAFLNAMANPHRLKVLDLLASQELPVNALTELVGLSQSALSQHLAKLRALKLVKTRRDAQTIYYSLSFEGVSVILDTLTQIFDGSRSTQLPETITSSSR
ncbi:transcriptional regulator [Rhizobium tubonense]|uniref:Transcriptional regulator n=2 Tax=Rhizobium tubonense TaxID=484088 RepID=A0A2W4CP13_9HYPH|nr:transcriptional regulator [Rhizobium tubonense]